MVKNRPANAGDTRDVGSIPGSGGSPGGGNATHSSILAWEIPLTEEPSGHKELYTTEQLNIQHFKHKTHCSSMIFKPAFPSYWFPHQ